MKTQEEELRKKIFNCRPADEDGTCTKCKLFCCACELCYCCYPLNVDSVVALIQSELARQEAKHKEELKPSNSGELKNMNGILVDFAEQWELPTRYMTNDKPPARQRIFARNKLLEATIAQLESKGEKE